MNKVVKILAVVLGVILVLGIVASAYAWGNKQWFDTTYSFERAIIRLHDYHIVAGVVESWIDFENSDQIQVMIDGVTYLTHISNVCLISE